MPFDFEFAKSILPHLLEASLITIKATFVSFAIALVAGLFLALGLRSRLALVRERRDRLVRRQQPAPGGPRQGRVGGGHDRSYRMRGSTTA